MHEVLKKLIKDSAALARLEEMWLIKWHQETGFSAKRPAEQWLIVIMEYLNENP